MKYVTLTEVQAFDVFMEYVTSTAVVLSMIIYLALNTSLALRPRKHRFVLFNAEGGRKEQLVKKLRYEVLSY